MFSAKWLTSGGTVVVGRQMRSRMDMRCCWRQKWWARTLLSRRLELPRAVLQTLRRRADYRAPEGSRCWGRRSSPLPAVCRSACARHRSSALTRRASWRPQRRNCRRLPARMRTIRESGLLHGLSLGSGSQNLSITWSEIDQQVSTHSGSPCSFQERWAFDTTTPAGNLNMQPSWLLTQWGSLCSLKVQTTVFITIQKPSPVSMSITEVRNGRGCRNMIKCFYLRLPRCLMLGYAVSVAAIGAGESGLRELKTVHIEGGEFASLEPMVPFDNPDGCGSSALAFFMASSPGYREKLSAAFTAQATGQKIYGWFTGCTSSPWGYSVPVMSSIAITK